MSEREYESQALAALNKAVAAALERKRRLGQYAVVWRDGRPQRIEPGKMDVASGYARFDKKGVTGVQDVGKGEPDCRKD